MGLLLSRAQGDAPGGVTAPRSQGRAVVTAGPMWTGQPPAPLDHTLTPDLAPTSAYPRRCRVEPAGPQLPSAKGGWRGPPRQSSNLQHAATKARRLRPGTQQPRARDPSHMPAPEAAWEGAASVLGGGLWSLQGWALDNLSPNLSSSSSIHASSEEKSPYDGGGQSQSPPGPGHGSGHTSGHHTCHVSRVKHWSQGLQTGRVPSGLVLNAVDESPEEHWAE